MSARELSRAYLARQLLLRRAAIDPVRALRRLVAVQAQYSPSPYLALAARLEPFTIADLEGCLRAGVIVKSTLMRGTLHLTAASWYPDIAAVVHAGSVQHWERVWGQPGVDTHALARGLAGYLAMPRTAAQIRAHADALTGGALQPGADGPSLICPMRFRWQNTSLCAAGSADSSAVQPDQIGGDARGPVPGVPSTHRDLAACARSAFTAGRRSR